MELVFEDGVAFEEDESAGYNTEDDAMPTPKTMNQPLLNNMRQPQRMSCS